MSGSDYIFCLQDSQHRFWKVDNTGKVYCSAQPYLLEFAPAGWDEIEIQNVRNKRYWGIDRSVSVPLSYIQDGAKILKHIFYKKGIEESVYLVIAKQELEYLPGASYGYWYKQIFRAEVDLSVFLHAGSKITCTTLEDGLPKYLKANENTVYEFPMNVPEAINVKMDGIRLHEKLNYEDISGLEVSILAYGESFIGPCSFVGKEGDSIGFAIDSETIESTGGLSFPDKLLKTNTVLTNVGNSTIDINISGTIEFTCTGMTSAPAYASRFRFLRSNQLVGNQNDYQIISTPAMVVGQVYSQAFDITVPLANGEKLFREGIFFGGPGSDAKIEFTENSKFSIKFITRQATTYVKAFTAQYLFNQLIDKITESNYVAALTSYFTNNRQKVFTCGNALRGLSDATMKISFSIFFQDWDCYDSVGINEQEGVVNFDSKVHLKDLGNVIDLPAPAYGTFKVSVAKDFLYNEVEYGYPEIKNEVGVLNGNEEFNCKYLASIGTTKSPAKLDKVSKIKASCYEIELIRVTTLAKDTTDNKADNDLFSLYIEDTLNPEIDNVPAHYNLDRSLNATATGLLEPETVFNLELSPKRNLLRNGPFLRSSLYLADSRVLAYQSSDKNNKLVCGSITEKEDVSISSLGDKFFYPIILEGDFEAPDDLISLLDLNPLQVFRFPVDGNYYYGLLQKVSIAPSTRKEQSYQFLSDSSNDLTNLINYFG